MNETKKSLKKMPVAKKRRKAKRSDFYRLRCRADLVNVEKAAEVCGVTARTIEKWDAKGAPATVMRLLHLHDRKHCGGAGPGWDGWMFSRGKLINARLKAQFRPEHLEMWRPICERLDRAEAELERTRRQCPVMRLARRAKTLFKGLLRGIHARSARGHWYGVGGHRGSAERHARLRP